MARGPFSPFANGYLNHLRRNMSTAIPCRVCFGAISPSQRRVGAATLAQKFVEKDRPRHRNVKRADLSEHGNSRQKITFPQNQRAHPFTLAAYDNCQTIRIGPLVNAFPARTIQAHKPIAVFFEVGDGPAQIGYLGDAQMVCRTCGCFHNDRRNIHRAIFGNNDMFHADRLRGSEQSTKIARVS